MHTEEDVMMYYEDHDCNEYTLMGEFELFDDHDAIVENTLGDLNLKGKAKTVTVELYTKEGWMKPHLHVYNDNFRTAIRLDINEYFIHGKYKDKFNDKQAKLFDEFMREIPKDVEMTRWQLARSLFNLEFPSHTIKIKEQPKYNMINYT